MHYGNWLASNSATLIISIVCVIIFARIIYRLDCHYSKILLILFVLSPLYLINSATTMDYVWALGLNLAGFLALLHNREKLGGALVGISAGFRPTGILFLFPFSIWLWLKYKSIKKVLFFILFTTSLGVAAYFPVLYKYGTQLLLHKYEPSLSSKLDLHLIYFLYKGARLWGTLASIYLLIVLAYLLIKRKLFNKNSFSALFWSILIIYLSVFLFYCDEPAYLLPIVPFLLIFLDKVLPRRYLILFMLLCLSFNFINIDVYPQKGMDLRPTRLEGYKVIKNIQPHIARGAYLEELYQRRIILAARNKLLKIDLGDNAVVIIDVPLKISFKNSNFELPQKESKDKIAIENLKGYAGKSIFRNTHLFGLMSYDNLKKTTQLTRNVYYVGRRTKRTLMIREGYNIDNFGAKQITYEELLE